MFFAVTSLDDMVKFVHRLYVKPRSKRSRPKSLDQELGHRLTKIEDAYYATGSRKHRTPKNQRRMQNVTLANRKSQIANPRTIGFTGPGRAGKPQLIDERARAFL